MYHLKTTQTVTAPLNEVYDFFARPENLAAITPDWLGFEILTPSPIPMKEGALIDYQIHLGPLPTRWRTLITSYEPGVSFVDEQLAGPYSFWHHTHRFRSTDSGGTELVDEVRFLPPFGFLGTIAVELMIKRQLLGIFRHRHRVIADRFGGSLEDCEGPVLRRL
ncbi:CDP-paratose 2-epimerase [bacterium DOLZORAL124_64_63]|nr:MAG: CDP-paratose 2-epimerase [bacterium DOLZORAL124_64_63]